MRAKPAVTVENLGNLYLNGNGQNLKPTACSVVNSTDSGVTLAFTVSEAVASQAYVLRESNPPGIVITAEL